MCEEIEKSLAIYIGRSLKFSLSSILLGIDNSKASGNEQKVISQAILRAKMCVSVNLKIENLIT